MVLKNHKNIGFLSNSDPDPLKNYEATKQAFNFGRQADDGLLSKHSMLGQRNAI